MIAAIPNIISIEITRPGTRWLVLIFGEVGL